jgi:sugar phosphate permease
VLAPALRERYDLSLTEVGIALSSVWIGPILTLLPWGLLADRVGERVVLASGLTACAVLVAATGWAHSFLTLVVLLAVAGGMGASVNAASGRAVMHWFPARERGLALGLRQTAIPIGGALAAVTLPAVNGAGGLKASFIFMGAVCLASAGVAAAAIRETPGSVPELAAEDVEWTLRDSRLWVLSTGSGLYLFAQISLTAFLVLFLHDVHGLSAGAAAAVLAVLQVGAVVTRISAGRISDAMQARIRPLRWIGLASCAGVLLTAVVTTAPTWSTARTAAAAPALSP